MRVFYGCVHPQFPPFGRAGFVIRSNRAPTRCARPLQLAALSLTLNSARDLSPFHDPAPASFAVCHYRPQQAVRSARCSLCLHCSLLRGRGVAVLDAALVPRSFTPADARLALWFRMLWGRVTATTADVHPAMQLASRRGVAALRTRAEVSAHGYARFACANLSDVESR